MSFSSGLEVVMDADALAGNQPVSSCIHLLRQCYSQHLLYLNPKGI